MRYNDEQLFHLDNKSLNELKAQLRFNEFCIWAISRLNYLIEESTNQVGWMSTDINHLRNYRAKAVQFYEQKRGE